MNRTQLQQTLEKLQSELNKAETVDDETRAKLVALSADIERLADQPDHWDSLTQNVQDYMLKFEAEHPQLTSALNQVSAALANLGI